VRQSSQRPCITRDSASLWMLSPSYITCIRALAAEYFGFGHYRPMFARSLCRLVPVQARVAASALHILASPTSGRCVGQVSRLFQCRLTATLCLTVRPSRTRFVASLKCVASDALPAHAHGVAGRLNSGVRPC
jgi:hypothetical protein